MPDSIDHAEIYRSTGTHIDPVSGQLVLDGTHFDAATGKVIIDGAPCVLEQANASVALTVDPIDGKMKANYDSIVPVSNSPTGRYSYLIRNVQASGATSDENIVTINAPGGTPGTLQWLRFLPISGNGPTPLGNKIAVYSASNVYIAGGFPTSIDAGNGFVQSTGDLDIYLAKYTSDNNLVAPFTPKTLAPTGAGSGRNDLATGALVDSSGNIIIFGTWTPGEMVTATMDFGNGHSFTASPGQGIQCGWVAKYSADGTCLWARNFNNGSTVNVYVACLAGNDDVICAVQFKGQMDFGNGNRGPVNGYNYGLVRLDHSNGTSIWSQGWGTASSAAYNNPGGIAVAGDGSILVTGQIFGQTDLGGGTTSSSGLYLAKYNGSTGAWIWNYTHGPSQSGNSVAVHPSGNIIVATQIFANGVDFGNGVILGSEIQAGGSGATMVCFNSSGVPQWGKVWGGGNSNSFSQGKAVAVNAAGTIAFGGKIQDGIILFGQYPFDPYVEGVGLFLAIFESPSGGMPVRYKWVAREQRYPGSTGAPAGAAKSIVFDNAGNVYVSGQTFGGDQPAGFGNGLLAGGSGTTVITQTIPPQAPPTVPPPTGVFILKYVL